MDKVPTLQKRQNLYKSNSSTPPWKDAYRKRCQDRLKKSREKFLERHRGSNDLCRETASGIANSMVEALMQEEFRRMRLERQEMLALEDPYEAQPTQEDDDYFAIFSEIREELIREEQQILSEYEAGLSFDDAAMSSAMRDPSEEVICPVCQRNPLHINHGVVFCSCGIRIDTEQDCFTLSNIRQNLEEGPKQHNPSCPGQAQYSVVGMGIMNMLMTCTTCDFMHIIV